MNVGTFLPLKADNFHFSIMGNIKTAEIEHLFPHGLLKRRKRKEDSLTLNQQDLLVGLRWPT